MCILFFFFFFFFLSSGRLGPLLPIQSYDNQSCAARDSRWRGVGGEGENLCSVVDPVLLMIKLINPFTVAITFFLSVYAFGVRFKIVA